MEVNQIKLMDGLPSEVTVTMSMAEAAAIAEVFGAMNGYAHQKLGIGGIYPGPYDALVGELINRYWDDGLREFRSTPISLETLNEPQK
jgi:hypothetical protein